MLPNWKWDFLLSFEKNASVYINIYSFWLNDIESGGISQATQATGFFLKLLEHTHKHLF